MILLHDHAAALLLGVAVLVAYLGVALVFNRFRDRRTIDGHALETV